jgi:predicted RecB family nuclease
MQKNNGIILYSASDLVNFLDCEYITALDLVDLETPLPRTEDDDEAILFQTKGLAHEAFYRDNLRQRASSFVDIAAEKLAVDAALNATLDAMRSGVEIIYQAVLADECFIGHADFLRRVNKLSDLGNFSYEVVDTKLSRTAKAKYIIQLCVYSELLARAQNCEPMMMHVVFGDRREESFRYADFSRYYASLKERFLSSVQSKEFHPYPVTCEHCDFCRWVNLCSERWLQDDHLNQVANISRIQINKLGEHGVTTLEALAKLEEDVVMPRMSPETLGRLRHQAALQLRKRTTGDNCFDLLPTDPEKSRGFSRMPKPDKGDIFFDMEGDTFEESGLEYLFGVYFLEGEKLHYRPLWAHTRDEEKEAFARFMDFVTERFREYPNAHIYHYGNYEEAALKKLMCLHGVCEAEVDNLLRFGKLVDLYRVVREGMRISEPRYSLKNVEHFYLDSRTTEIKNASASIVHYERWKETRNPALLENIAAYNHDDVRSTYGLREWILINRPPHLPWPDSSMVGRTTISKDISVLNEEELRLLRYRRLLLDPLPENRDDWTPGHYAKELTYQLLDFHRRAAKPVWWALFSRREMSHEDLIEDVEAIGGMTLDRINPPYPEKRSFVYTYFYPEQETKLKTGDNCVVTDTLDSINQLVVDEDIRKITFTYPNRKDELPERLSIGRGGPISAESLKEAIFRFADNIIAGSGKYPALEAILNQEVPRIRGRHKEHAIIDDSSETMSQIIESVSELDYSYVFIQGPPGTGKTYAGSRIIVELLRRQKRVGVSSNSHKAINNLLAAVEAVAAQKKVMFRGVKKSTDNEDSLFAGKYIKDVFSNEGVYDDNWQLIAGTAWLFSDGNLDQKLDYLFVDEAGQVALANLVAMGTSANNIILLGDQMQLSQPIQGVHPGRSGESSLDYLLNGVATIPPERGIFLKTTWRMHPNICSFISDAVYDGRLVPARSNMRQRLQLGFEAHPVLKQTGIFYVPIEHDGCSQRSQEEAQLVLEIYTDLLKQHFISKQGKSHPIMTDNILVVAPYNMQVNLLRRMLPRGARVGTIDKFQGQEAEVVIVSMTTSNGDYLPRFIEFLYSKNRLNVALSRAKCLALLIASPALMAVRCRTVEEMALVNTLCWVKDYSETQKRGPS